MWYSDLLEFDDEKEIARLLQSEKIRKPQGEQPVDYNKIFDDLDFSGVDQCDCFEPKDEEIERFFGSLRETTVQEVYPEIDRCPGTSTRPQSRPQPPPPSPTTTLPQKKPRVEKEPVTISDESDDEVDKLQEHFKTGLEVFHQQNPGVSLPKPSPEIKLGKAPKIGLSRRFRPPETSNSTEKKSETENTSEFPNIPDELVEVIKNEIMDHGKNVTWDDISGLEYAKSIIKETVVMPQLRPDLFTGLRRPPKGILLFGPPGTGKTLIGKCIASQSNSKFFSISASTLTSKWIGEGEKLVRALFTVASAVQPSVIFIDEIDSLLSQRKGQEHESSRRLKTEFLIRLDGATTAEDDRVLIIGATNRPQELDEAARRRLVKRLYIPLPEEKAREDMLRRLSSKVNHNLKDGDFSALAKATGGYSGADMKSLCQEAAMGPIRDISMENLQHIQETAVRQVSHGDFVQALKRVKASVDQKELESYVEWDKMFGSG